MKRLAGVALFVPLALAFGAFTVENLQPVALNFWPLPVGVEIPVSVWTFTAVAAGVVIGIAVGWMAGSRWRRRARSAERRLRRLERESRRETVPALPGPSAKASPARLSDD